jgi:hypothetical protein
MKGTTPSTHLAESRAVRMRYAAQYLTLATTLAILAFDAHERIAGR